MSGDLILVTGYGGFLGASIVRRLLEFGYRVRGLARSDYPELRRLGVEPVQASLTDVNSVARAMEGCTGVVHTAARAGVWGAWQEYFDPNVRGTEILLAAARRSGVRAFVYTSSPSVTFAAKHQSGIDETTPYPNRWLCHYPHTKALAEQMVLRAAGSELGTCALRPHLIWGEGDPHLMPRVIQKALAGRLKRVGSGTNLIDVVHVDRAALAHVDALRRLLGGASEVSGQAYFLTDGRPQECWSWIGRILDGAGVDVPRGAVSYRVAYAIGAVMEGCYRALRIRREPPMTRFVAAQLALDHYFSIGKAKRELGYRPIDDFDAVFDECRPWLKRVAEAIRSGRTLPSGHA
ncbi:MAG: NAD-dependent epimerase/dehydratase family protein [Pirellulales bacterium]